MNKAFVRDPEPAEPRCPAPEGCDGIGVPVTRKTLLAQLPHDTAERFAETSYYCRNPHCPVAYFDQWGISVKRTELRSLAYPKSPTAPVCSCFGVNEEEIREDAESGRKDRVRELIARAETSAARCETESPSGASCVVEVRKIFLKYFSPSAY